MILGPIEFTTGDLVSGPSIVFSIFGILLLLLWLQLGLYCFAFFSVLQIRNAETYN